jgi:hypothetical protein
MDGICSARVLVHCVIYEGVTRVFKCPLGVMNKEKVSALATFAPPHPRRPLSTTPSRQSP